MSGFERAGKSSRERDMARGAHLFRVTEDILVAMEDLAISKAELARRLGLSKARITQLLSGDSNMTIGTLADISFELGLTLEKTLKEYSALRVYQQLDPEGIDLALKRDREIAAGHTNAIGKDEFLRRIRRN